MIIQEVPACR